MKLSYIVKYYVNCETTIQTRNKNQRKYEKLKNVKKALLEKMFC